MTDELHTLDISSPERWAERAADVMAAAIGQAIGRSGRCLMALSGGSTRVRCSTPWPIATCCGTT